MERERLVELKINSDLRIGYKKDSLLVDCSAFADDCAILAESPLIAEQQVNVLEEEDEKIGLQISFEKTE